MWQRQCHPVMWLAEVVVCVSVYGSVMGRSEGMMTWHGEVVG